MPIDPYKSTRGSYRDVELGAAPLGEPSASSKGNGVDDWEEEEQQTLLDRQDSTLDVLSGALGTIGGQARLMGREVNEQNVMLDELDTQVDSTEGKLNKATKRIKDFIEKSEEKGSGWCIVILTIILVILLISVILI